MRGKIKKGIALFLSAMLSVATCVTTIPQLSETVLAAGTGKNIQLGASALEDNVNTSSAATVHYDSSSDTWRVIGYGGTGVASSSGTLTLIASGNMEHGFFDSSSPYSNNYSGSNLQSVIITLAGRLSTEEEAAVATRTLEGGSGNQGITGTPPYDDNKISGSDVSDAVMWPLSVAEANLMNSDLRKADPANPGLAKSSWWLRSPGDAVNYAAFVNGYGDVFDFGGPVNFDGFAGIGIRPAFNLNLSSIIFTSDAAGIKSSGAAGTLSKPGDHSTENWKLTVASDSLTASSGTVTRSGSTITVPFTASGSYDRISVFISDGAWNANGAVLKYYGALNTSGSSGTFTLPDDYDTSWKVYILAEKTNGNTETDYASTPAEITIPDASGGGGPAPGPGPSPSPAPSGDDDHSDSGSSDSKPKDENPYDYLDELCAKLATAISRGGEQTVLWDKGTALPYDIMKTLQDNPKITLVFNYTYQGKNYKATIPGRNVKTDPKIPWYGPLYLNGYFGANASANVNIKPMETGAVYTVKKGDTLGAIARRLNTTVDYLVKVNNIADRDKIREGQILKY
ncbi:MAG: LysM peptidoglycan-binding domain-containing protein [Lachnospiraceae bacterium]|nr:LysM peptidoglycan-binding domain-containing protein [Lachnospiraceae bacterium]